MGRYIGFGIAYRYVISKAELEEKYQWANCDKKPLSDSGYQS